MARPELPPEPPRELTEEEAFLAGPERHESWTNGEIEGDLLDVDWIFGHRFADLYAGQESFRPGSTAILENEPITTALADPSYRFAACEGGLLLLAASGVPVGGYLGQDIAIDEAHQGQGLGAELVAECYLRQGEVPVWNLDIPAYSPAGEACHRAAWHLLRDPGFLRAKEAALGLR